MGLFDWLSGKEKSEKNTPLWIGEINYFVYFSASGEVSFKQVKVTSIDIDKNKLQGIDLSAHKSKTYRLDRILRIFQEKEIQNLSEQQLNQIIEDFVVELSNAAENKEEQSKTEKTLTFNENRRFNHKRVVDRNIDELIGLARGILADGKVDKTEAETLQKWLIAVSGMEHPMLQNLLMKVNEMLEDNVLDDEESAELFETLNNFIGGNFEKGEILKPTSLPLENPEPDITIRGSSFCFTGTFTTGTRKEVEAMVEEKGGKATRLNGSTDYLVIGAYATDSWIHSSYGRKIEQALDFQKKGGEIKIISEEHWLKFF